MGLKESWLRTEGSISNLILANAAWSKEKKGKIFLFVQERVQKMLGQFLYAYIVPVLYVRHENMILSIYVSY